MLEYKSNTPTFCKTKQNTSNSMIFFFSVLGLELGAFTLSHNTSTTFVKGFSR
jgi:hypothetical protein